MVEPVKFKRVETPKPAAPAQEPRPMPAFHFGRELWVLIIFVAGACFGSIGTLAATTALFKPIADVTATGVAIGAAQQGDGE